MYTSFISKYQSFFRVAKEDSIKQKYQNMFKVRKTYYQWSDNNYREFMIDMCQTLEPRHEKRKTTLMDELDEISEIIFVTKGSVAVGYRVNNV